MSIPKPPRKRIQMHFDVASDDQAAELTARYEEIVAGKRARIATAADDALEVMERALTGLMRIVKAIEEAVDRLGGYNVPQTNSSANESRQLSTQIDLTRVLRHLALARL